MQATISVPTKPQTATRSQLNRVLGLLSVATLMGVLDFSIVNVALPSIQREFHIAPAELQWVVSAYGMVFGGFLLLGGRAGDLFDRKVLFMVGLGVFSAASLVGGLAPTVLILLAARALQGLGAAILAPTSLSLATAIFPEGRERNRAMGAFGAVAAIGFGLGVIMGGLLTNFLGWRSVFFVNVPIGAIAIVVAGRILPSVAPTGSRHALDVGGAVLGTAGIVTLLVGLTRLAASAGGYLQAVLLSVIAVSLFGAFLWAERRAPNPLVPLGIFRTANVTVGNLVAAADIAVAALLAFVLTLYVQGVMGYSPLQTGLIFVPASIGGIAGGAVVGRLIKRIGLQRTATTTILTFALGIAILVPISAGGSPVLVLLGYAVGAVGLVGTSVVSMIVATSGIGRDRQGLVSGLLSTSQQFGGAVGVTLASVVATVMTRAIGGIGGAAVVVGFRAALVAGLVLLGAALLIVRSTLRTK